MRHDLNNIMVILSSPSGAGKTTITKKIQQKYQSFKISVSHTTRKPRQNEIDGVDYFFVKNEEFKKLAEDGKFYEYAKIFDNYYGTSKSSINQITDNGLNVLFDIDWQGAAQLSKYKNLNLLKIFILPPSIEELEKRLILRNQDDKNAIKRRLSTYSKDIVHSKNYDHVIVNDNIEKCFTKIKKIISDHLKKNN